VIACGGGVHNGLLMERIRVALDGIPLDSSREHGIDPDFVEAALFAWLARECLARRPGNLPAVSGARGPRVLGAIYPP
jgi:anhydro-N-acetylmuramic acid kinase